MSPRIVFLIRDLAYGGAQRQLLTLAKGLCRDGAEVVVLHFYHGRMESELRSSGVRVVCLEKKGRWDLLKFVRRLYLTIREIKPTVLHSYMAESNLLSAVLKPFLPGVRVVWGLRDSKPDAALYGMAARMSFQMGRMLSNIPDLIIANSRSGREFYGSIGFPKDKLTVVPNGIDIGRFSMDRKAGQELRKEWDVSPGQTLFGLIGRMNPMKDHATFFKAAAIVARESSEARFICIGDGPAYYKAEIKELSASLGIGDRIIWSDGRPDMPAVYNALDVLVSASSFGEGFSNVIGEAMACGVPCLVTDVGDSAWLVDETGFSVEPENPEALANAIRRFLGLPLEARLELGSRARARIEANFTVEMMVRSTRELCFEQAASPALAIPQHA